MFFQDRKKKKDFYNWYSNRIKMKRFDVKENFFVWQSYRSCIEMKSRWMKREMATIYFVVVKEIESNV